jgi:hypothetical protein
MCSKFIGMSLNTVSTLELPTRLQLIVVASQRG